jgi:hypothetical protein
MNGAATALALDRPIRSTEATAIEPDAAAVPSEIERQIGEATASAGVRLRSWGFNDCPPSELRGAVAPAALKGFRGKISTGIKRFG